MTLNEIIEKHPNGMLRLTLADGEIDLPVSAILEFTPQVELTESFVADDTLWTLTIPDD